MVVTIEEEKDHESWRQSHQQQKLKRQREQSHLAKQVVDQEIMAARISIPVFAEGVFHASIDATALVNTPLSPSESRKKRFPKFVNVKRFQSQDSCPCVGC